jgi:hypothetical protein
MPRAARLLFYSLGSLSALLLVATLVAWHSSSGRSLRYLRHIGPSHVFVLCQSQWQRWQIYYGPPPAYPRYLPPAGWSAGTWDVLDEPPQDRSDTPYQREWRLRYLLNSQRSLRFGYLTTAGILAILPAYILFRQRKSIVAVAQRSPLRLVPAKAYALAFFLWFACFVWPTPYSYGVGITGPGHLGVPYRINRFTGKTEWHHRWTDTWEEDRPRVFSRPPQS